MPGRAQAYTEAVTEANVHRFVRNLGGPEEQASPIQAAEEGVSLHLVQAAEEGVSLHLGGSLHLVASPMYLHT